MSALTLLELSERVGARLEGCVPEREAHLITGPASLADAGESEVSFLTDAQYMEGLLATHAGAVVVAEDLEVPRTDLPCLRCSDPQATFSEIVELFAPPQKKVPQGVHPTAVVETGAVIHGEAAIGPHCVVGAGAQVAAGVQLHARVVVGAESSVGAGTVLHPGVVLYPQVRIGEGCIVHAGTVIGSDGFGFEPTPDGWVKTPQGGTVVIEDDVEIGANVTIDCARFGRTHIGRNVKIDNLVHIAHNVRIDESALFLAQSAVAGSTQVGKGVILAGQSGLGGHLNIGAGARIGAKSAVFSDIPAGEDWWGSPAGPKTASLRAQKSLQRIESMRKQIQTLTARVQSLEEDRS